jgi:hypothetical protein
MFKCRFVGIGLVLLSGIILLSSCAKAPEKEMQAAREAVANATNAEADIYAQDLFVTAQDSLNQAEMLLSEKKYAEAKRLAIFAKSWADSSATLAQTNKEEMKVTAETSINDATSMLEALKEAKVPSRLKAKINDEVKGCENVLKEAKDALEIGNYKDAFDKASDVSNRVEEAKKEIIKARGVVGS